MPPRSAVLDTDPESERALHEALRRRSPGDRLLLVTALIAEAEALTAAGIRHREPGISEDDLADRLAELRLGPELWAEVRSERARRDG